MASGSVLVLCLMFLFVVLLVFECTVSSVDLFPLLFCLICSSQRIRCSHHPEAPLIEDYRAGDMICSECGLVVGDRYGLLWLRSSSICGLHIRRNSRIFLLGKGPLQKLNHVLKS